jgi:plastocyanin
MSKPSLALISMLCSTLALACSNDASGPQPADIPANATVTANQSGGWSPSPVLLKAGGTVTWVIPNNVLITRVEFNPWDSNAETLNVVNGSVARAFPTRGIFYFCAAEYCPSDAIHGEKLFEVHVL